MWGTIAGPHTPLDENSGPFGSVRREAFRVSAAFRIREGFNNDRHLDRQGRARLDRRLFGGQRRREPAPVRRMAVVRSVRAVAHRAVCELRPPAVHGRSRQASRVRHAPRQRGAAAIHHRRGGVSPYHGEGASRRAHSAPGDRGAGERGACPVAAGEEARCA